MNTDVLRCWNDAPKPVVMSDGDVVSPFDAFEHALGADGLPFDRDGIPMPWNTYRTAMDYDVEGELVVSDWKTTNCTFLRASITGGEGTQIVDISPTTVWCGDDARPAVVRFSIPASEIIRGKWTWNLSIHVTDTPGYFEKPREYSFESLTIRYVYREA